MTCMRDICWTGFIFFVRKRPSISTFRHYFLLRCFRGRVHWEGQADVVRGEAPAEPRHQQAARRQTGPRRAHNPNARALAEELQPGWDRDRLWDSEALHAERAGEIRVQLPQEEEKAIRWVVRVCLSTPLFKDCHMTSQQCCCPWVTAPVQDGLVLPLGIK